MFFFLKEGNNGITFDSSLGMDHNDNTECREDPTEKQGLMGKRRTGWSSCSTRAFKELIR